MTVRYGPAASLGFVDAEAGQLRRGFWRLRMAVATLRGWRRFAVAFVAGALAAAAMPPLHAVPLLVPAFVAVLWLLDAPAGRRQSALAVGWWFGLGFFVAGLYWVANAFQVAAVPIGWAGPPAVVGLAGLLALFTAAATWLTRLTAARGIALVVAFAASWTVAEWLRSWVLTGFPWNLVGTVWVFSDAMMQATAAIGTYGLGFFTIIAAAMPAALAVPGVRQRLALGAMAASLALLAILWAGGALRLALAGEAGAVDGVRLRLVQPNISQAMKWRRELLDDHLALHLALSTQPATPPPTHIVWSETAAPAFLDEDDARRQLIAAATPESGLTLVGTLRRTPPGEPFRVWNAMQAVDARGTIVATYDKVHLVPFGEYIPLRHVLGIGKLTAGSTDFSTGPGLTTLHLAGLPPVSPLICYEAIFPGDVIERGDPPRWLLNLTNDAWYGRSAGPYQHFAAVRLRAVEEGLPIVRVANTGISAIVDPYGRVIAHLGLEEQGTIDSPLPRALDHRPPYARYGDLIPLALAGFCLVLTWVVSHPVRRRTIDP